SMGGDRIDQLEPAERGMGYVPQDYALFSSRNVRRNIELGLRVQGVPAATRESRIADVAAMLGIAHLLDRGIEGLSGGERQRVALARALAVEPRVLLLDEPVNSLDPETRDTILAELRRIQLTTGTSTVHVCHDLDEMRAVANRVGIMHEGRLAQVGTPAEVAESPATPAVARLLRLGGVFRGVATPEAGSARIDLADFTVHADQSVGGEVDVLIRASRVQVRPPTADGGLQATVRSTLPRDPSLRVELDIGQAVVPAEITQSEELAPHLVPGGEVRVGIPTEAVYVF
ncbi:MAG TPA: ABC transporter ATP-binding protein, partial [Armatimonadota bacterium]|nr:ABC transporter ATP-binding protein [Armatimonadota bacterium]